MGFINALYYAFLAAMSWMMLKAFRTKLPDSPFEQISVPGLIIGGLQIDMDGTYVR
jgi:hypothetical protein